MFRYLPLWGIKLGHMKLAEIAMLHFLSQLREPDINQEVYGIPEY